MTVLVSIQQPVRAWQIPDEAVAVLRQRFPRVSFVHATDAEARRRALATCEVAYTWILSAAELAQAPLLRWVHSSAVAVETLCLPELFARGILVSNSRGVQAIPIAEHVLAVTLALAKQLPFALEHQRSSRWVQNDFGGERLPWLLRGRTLGLIGLGTIGREIARLAAAFGMRVVALRRRPDAGPIADVHQVLPPSALDVLLAAADVVVIAAPLTPETDRLIGARELARMKPQAILVNVGRARILDTDALVDALAARRLGGAALDVFPQEPLPEDHPLWTCPNVLLTPHTSGFRQGHWDDVIDLFSENLRRFERGEELLYSVRAEWGY
jgi:phosphoglycerate dehydrogenase-like enzyme